MNTNDSVQTLVQEGLRHFEAGEREEALRCLRAAHTRSPQDAKVRSHYGVCLASAERRFAEALELCNSALKQEFFNPDLYYNAALVYRMFDFKADAIRCLRRGRMIDPGHQLIHDTLRELGRRRGPVLRFLPRGHAINRLLGHARHRMQRIAA